jgi:hypothetical protein
MTRKEKDCEAERLHVPFDRLIPLIPHPLTCHFVPVSGVVIIEHPVHLEGKILVYYVTATTSSIGITIPLLSIVLKIDCERFCKSGAYSREDFSA